MKHIFVINPAAGNGAAEREILPLIEKAAEKAGISFEVYRTQGSCDAERFTRMRCESGEVLRFYACGGDGTLNEVANGAYRFENAEITIIPAGTGNDFVRTFSNWQFFSDIDRQLEGRTVNIDLLTYNGRIGVNVCNIGFDSAVADKIDELKKFPFLQGRMAYIAGIALQFFKKLGTHMTITFDDGETLDGIYLLSAVGNGSYYGSGFCALPRATRVGEVLDVCLVKKIGRLQFLKLIKDYKAGKHTEKEEFRNCVIYRKCRSVTIKAYETVKLSADGEITSVSEVKLEVLPKAIRLSLPRGCDI